MRWHDLRELRSDVIGIKQAVFIRRGDLMGWGSQTCKERMSAAPGTRQKIGGDDSCSRVIIPADDFF